MLLKKPLAGRQFEVTFRMPQLEGVVELNLCGDFNGWHVKGAPLSQETDGSWFATLVLEGGKSYRFRYHDNQGRWHNDWEADGYAPNDFGSEDSVLDLTFLTEGPVKKSSKAPAKKKTATKKAAPKHTAGAAKKAGHGPQTKGKR